MRRGQTQKQRVTITFQPEPDVLTLINKAYKREVGSNSFKHGLRTRLINRAIRYGLAMKQTA